MRITLSTFYTRQAHEHQWGVYMLKFTNLDELRGINLASAH